MAEPAKRGRTDRSTYPTLRRSREEFNSGDGHMDGVYLQARPGVPKSQQVVSDNRCRTRRQYHARDNNPDPSR